MKGTGKAIYQRQKDLKNIYSNHKIISKIQQNRNNNKDIEKLGKNIKAQEKKFDKNYEYELKTKLKNKEIKNERAK